ncbi:MAG: class I SAM-dependent methyltransferase, partial [Paracoccaceae bacterium]
AMPKGALVLDLGSGPGHCAARMAAAGLRTDATDAAPEMVRLAQDQPGVSAWKASFDDLDATATYHGIWASFSLLHARKSAFAGHLSRIHRALGPDGLLCITMKLGSGEDRDSLGRFYAYYSDSELDRYLGGAGFSITGRTHGNATGMAGVTAPHVIINARA